mmetsp:Transcript_5262/g.16613  ORF Transcript_5262/g.16613 Transcript_5262/m.16613 type:complete len:216 (+) Transcript_5262:444-1091(+)
MRERGREFRAAERGRALEPRVLVARRRRHVPGSVQAVDARGQARAVLVPRLVRNLDAVVDRVERFHELLVVLEEAPLERFGLEARVEDFHNVAAVVLVDEARRRQLGLERARRVLGLRGLARRAVKRLEEAALVVVVAQRRVVVRGAHVDDDRQRLQHFRVARPRERRRRVSRQAPEQPDAERFVRLERAGVCADRGEQLGHLGLWEHRSTRARD